MFLYCGTVSILGQGMTTETGYLYAVKNEEWLGLGKNTRVFVMEQGAMEGICKSENRARWEAVEAKKKKPPWNNLLGKLGREPESETAQCPTQ